MTNITHIIDRALRQDIDIWTEEKIHLVNTQTAENAGEGRSEWEEKLVKLSDDWYRSHLFIGDLTISGWNGWQSCKGQHGSTEWPAPELSLVWEMLEYEESTAGVYLMEIISLEFIWAWAKCWNSLREMAELRANSWYGEKLSSWERGANIQTWRGLDLRMLLLLNIQHFHTMSCQHNCYRIPNIIPAL